MTERQLLLPCYALWSVRDGDKREDRTSPVTMSVL